MACSSPGIRKGSGSEHEVADPDILASVRTISTHAGAPNANLQGAIGTLTSNPSKAAPALAGCLSDLSKSRESRVRCSEVLKMAASDLDPASRDKLLAVLRDERQDPRARINVAVTLLQARPEPSKALRKEIKRVGFQLFKLGDYKDIVVLMILNRFGDDREVERFLVDQMRAEQEVYTRNGLLHQLGKRKCQALLGIIDKELCYVPAI